MAVSTIWYFCLVSFMQAESKVASFINSLKFQTSASIFCLGYWFIWNSPFEFLPRLATLTVKVFDKISHLCTINLHLKSDSLAQVVSIVLLLALSFLLFTDKVH